MIGMNEVLGIVGAVVITVGLAIGTAAVTKGSVSYTHLTLPTKA